MIKQNKVHITNAAAQTNDGTTATVVIEEAKRRNYLTDFVVLPWTFGTPAYDIRSDVRGIRACVDAALDTLDAQTHFTRQLAGDRLTIVKPNLVSVYHNSGFDKRDYPETTDPRVFEAVIRYLRRYTANIVIAESSGKPMPTPLAFRIAGYDRIARHYGTGLVALEQRPVVRYACPRAEVMKEVYLPDTLQPVVEGEAFYVSVPKMKTNLYTKVTLAFKNAMGAIPYFMRERNHSYLIEKKVADLLFVFKPDLTVIDAIIGGEGNTPAPVDPVCVGRIIASDHSVEADRVATAMMGFDPAEIPLMREADARGFAAARTRVIGDPVITPFRPAISSLMDEKTAREFPRLLALAGHTKNGAPHITDKDAVTPQMARALEQACTGGCVAAAKTGLDYYNYKQSARRDFALCIVVGEGVEIEGTRWWFDKTGRPYSLDDIAALPMNRLALGNCSMPAAPACNFFAEGCCDPAVCMAVTCKAAGETMPIMSPRNQALAGTVLGMLETVRIRRDLIRQGMYVDCPRSHEDRIFPIPEELSRSGQTDAADMPDHILWPLPPMSKEEQRRQLRDQRHIVLSALASGRR